MSQEEATSYDVRCHRDARHELDQVPEEPRQALVDLAYDAATFREPSSHPNAELLNGRGGLFRLRAGDYRAICGLDKPAVVLVAAGRRETVYDGLDDARNRLEG